MDIVLDSNIFNSDLKLKDKNFDIIKDYLSKTNSKIVVPQLVIDEIKNLYKKSLSNSVNVYAGSVQKLMGSMMTPPDHDYTQMSVDINSEVEKYTTHIIQKLEISPDQIIAYKNEYLTELVTRAINRTKPLGENGQQFRDGLLWLTILDYADDTENREIIFISANSNDFAEKKTRSLHKILLDECQSRNLNVHYYTSIEDFIATQASTIDFISVDWVDKNVDLGKIDKIFEASLGPAHDKYAMDFVEINRNERLTGYSNRTDFISSTIKDYYVYEKLNGEILLKLTMEFEVEYEVEIERISEKSESRYEYRVVTNPTNGKEEWNVDYVPDYIREQETNTIFGYPLFTGYFTVTIKNKEITEIDFTDWDLG